MDDRRIEIAAKLFEAWSSGDADAPARYLAPDAVLYDEYWVNDQGVALRWVMTATVTDDSLGPDAKGKQWRSEGMTYLVFDGDQVVREVDYHDSAAVPRSLGLAAKRPA